MTDMRSQPIYEDSTAPTDDEICDQVLGTRSCYIRRLEHRIRALPSSFSSKTDVYIACNVRLIEIQRQTAENRQRADELAVYVDLYQLFQT